MKFWRASCVTCIYQSHRVTTLVSFAKHSGMFFPTILLHRTRNKYFKWGSMNASVNYFWKDFFFLKYCGNPTVNWGTGTPKFSASACPKSTLLHAEGRLWQKEAGKDTTSNDGVQLNGSSQFFYRLVLQIVDLLSPCLENEGNSHSNRLELLPVSSGNEASKNWCLLFGLFLLFWDTLYSNMAFLKKLQNILYRFQCKTSVGLSKWWTGSARRHLFQGMSRKNSLRKTMWNWVFIINIEPFQSLQLQNLLTNSIRCLDII